MTTAISVLLRLVADEDHGGVVVVPRWLWDAALRDLFLPTDTSSELVEHALITLSRTAMRTEAA